MNIENSHIWLIDDEPHILETYASILKQDPNSIVQVFASGISALRAYDQIQTKPDIVITDFKVPGLNGIDLVSELRKRNSDVAAIIVSDYVDTKMLLDANALQLSGVLEKPFDWNALKNLITAIQRKGFYKNKLIELYKARSYISSQLISYLTQRYTQTENVLENACRCPIVDCSWDKVSAKSNFYENSLKKRLEELDESIQKISTQKCPL